MAILKRCLFCGKIIAVRPCLIKRKKFCSTAHADQWWKGKRRSPATEFKPGRNIKTMPVGTVRTRKGRRQGKRKAGKRKWIKVAQPSEWIPLARAVWEEHNGPIPEGMVIRHIDSESLNDAPDNLIALSRGQHLQKTLEDPEIFRLRRMRAMRALKLRWSEHRESQYDSFYWEAD